MKIRIMSKAHYLFETNMAEVDRLLEIHGLVGGSGRGRRSALEVLNKSAIVLLTACWEAYLEDEASSAFTRMLDPCHDPGLFPAKVRVMASKSLKEDRDERKVWDLAGEGWRQVMLRHRDEVLAEFHTPKSAKADQLFQRLLGLRNLSGSWKWQRMTPKMARRKLDRLVDIRGKIAHRAQHSVPIHKSWVRKYKEHVAVLVKKTDRAVNHYVEHSPPMPIPRRKRSPHIKG